ncbi:hypothetical protein [Mycoplasmoides pneumoniae]|uniref:hypothetical protein n=1 Tax=Mycoplasmoides pneumoniae TaxID=2104 RepID=UPI001556DC92|nr:hypothetical protein [Mycoplasmoides pneumoniae]
MLTLNLDLFTLRFLQFKHNINFTFNALQSALVAKSLSFSSSYWWITNSYVFDTFLLPELGSLGPFGNPGYLGFSGYSGFSRNFGNFGDFGISGVFGFSGLSSWSSIIVKSLSLK